MCTYLSEMFTSAGSCIIYGHQPSASFNYVISFAKWNIAGNVGRYRLTGVQAARKKVTGIRMSTVSESPFSCYVGLSDFQ